MTSVFEVRGLPRLSAANPCFEDIQMSNVVQVGVMLSMKFRRRPAFYIRHSFLDVVLQAHLFRARCNCGPGIPYIQTEYSGAPSAG